MDDLSELGEPIGDDHEKKVAQLGARKWTEKFGGDGFQGLGRGEEAHFLLLTYASEAILGAWSPRADGRRYIGFHQQPIVSPTKPRKNARPAGMTRELSVVRKVEEPLPGRLGDNDLFLLRYRPVKETQDAILSLEEERLGLGRKAGEDRLAEVVRILGRSDFGGQHRDGPVPRDQLQSAESMPPPKSRLRSKLRVYEEEIQTIWVRSNQSTE